MTQKSVSEVTLTIFEDAKSGINSENKDIGQQEIEWMC
jgi:hypothetical protein